VARSSASGVRRFCECGVVSYRFGLRGGIGMSRVDEILVVYIDKGSSDYGGEPVNQLEHALQTAMLAEHDGADASLIVASLLHDYGHLIHNFGEDVFKTGLDDRHEILGAENLSAHFGEAVTMPIRMHVEAKRYLCAIDPQYMKNLSPASIWSLKLQGDLFAAAEHDEFIKRPFAAEAARLRRWDESAKIYGLQTPPLDHFRPYVEACLIG
jgi:phosphonate degradation associated HDIG domain protein